MEFIPQLGRVRVYTAYEGEDAKRISFEMIVRLMLAAVILVTVKKY